MPEKLDKCVKEVEKKIKEGKVAKEYQDKATGKMKKSNPYAICNARVSQQIEEE